MILKQYKSVFNLREATKSETDKHKIAIRALFPGRVYRGVKYNKDKKRLIDWLIIWVLRRFGNIPAM